MPYDSRYIYIVGETTPETPIRPHNWAERFAGNMASYGTDRRLRYSPTLEPVVINGTKCLRVCPSLEASQPEIFHDVLGFANHYDLQVHGMEVIEPELAKAS